MTDNAPKLEIQPVTVQFTKGESVLLSHAQVLPGDTPEDDQVRWLFNMQQIASQNGLEVPSSAEPEYTAASESERDALAEKLLDAINKARVKAESLRNQVTDVFASALPVTKSEPQPTTASQLVPDGATPAAPASQE